MIYFYNENDLSYLKDSDKLLQLIEGVKASVRNAGLIVKKSHQESPIKLNDNFLEMTLTVQIPLPSCESKGE